MAKRLAKHDDIIRELLRDNRYKAIREGKLLTSISINGLGSIPNGIWLEVGRYDKDGYRIFEPRVNGKKIRIRINRVIYQAFNGELDKYLVVDHIDNNPQNDRADNLRLMNWSINANRHKNNLTHCA